MVFKTCHKNFFFLCQFEEAAMQAADESTRPRPEGEEEIQDIQVTLKSDANPDGIRYLKVHERFVKDLALRRLSLFITMHEYS